MISQLFKFLYFLSSYSTVISPSLSTVPPTVSLLFSLVLQESSSLHCHFTSPPSIESFFLKSSHSFWNECKCSARKCTVLRWRRSFYYIGGRAPPPLKRSCSRVAKALDCRAVVAGSTPPGGCYGIFIFAKENATVNTRLPSFVEKYRFCAFSVRNMPGIVRVNVLNMI